MSIIAKVIRANSVRRTRLHDEKGRFIGWSELGSVPAVTVQAIRRIAFGTLPQLPWWPLPFVRFIEARIRPDWVVWEYGSGMSTAWLAERAASVRSVEDSPEWHSRTEHMLRDLGADAICRLRGTEDYAAPLETVSPNLVIIDGQARDACVRTAIQHVRRPGYLYLDNSDATGLGIPEALVILESFGEGAIRHFTGLPPGMLTATRGTLLTLPPKVDA